MLFVIDVGNSHTVSGIYRNNELIAHWRVKTDRDITVDELVLNYYALFELNKLDPAGVKGVVISSVVPKLEPVWVTCCNRYFCTGDSCSPIVVSNENVSHLIEILLDNPKEVGADRLVNSIAAFQKYQTSLIVIDFGTAITFDCVSRDCQYLGGLILPGINLSLEALSSKTAKLPHIDISSPPTAMIGRNTVDAMKSGILHGYSLMIEELTCSLKKELGDEDSCRVLATGGMASVISPYTSSIDEVLPLLTLDGLKIIYDSSRT